MHAVLSVITQVQFTEYNTVLCTEKTMLLYTLVRCLSWHLSHVCSIVSSHHKTSLHLTAPLLIDDPELFRRSSGNPLSKFKKILSIFGTDEATGMHFNNIWQADKFGKY